MGASSSPRAGTAIRASSTIALPDQGQRRVPLAVSGTMPGQITIAAPANGNIAPPGFYMLFILNEYATNQFAPCETAWYVQVGY